LFGAHSDYQRYNLPIYGLTIFLIAVIFKENSSKVQSSRVFKIVIGLLVSLAVTFNFIVSAPEKFLNFSTSASTYSYVQEARIDAGKYSSSTLSKERILSGDIGALSFYSLGNQWIDSSGLTNSSLIHDITSGKSYREFIFQSEPSYLIDTVNANGIAGSEEIYNNPSGYFNLLGIEIQSTSECTFKEVFRPKVLKVFPDTVKDNLTIQIWKLNKVKSKAEVCF
jgi:hypothetical protein